MRPLRYFINVTVAMFCVAGFAASICSGALADEKEAQQSKLYTPQPEHEILKRFEGEWRFEKFLVAADGSTSGKLGAGKITAELLGGFFVVSKWSGNVYDTDYAAVQTLGYDVDKKAYSGLWIDNTMSYQWQLHGSLEVDSKELVITASGPGPSGGIRQFRERYQFKSADSITIVGETLQDKKWVKFITTQLTRKEKAAKETNKMMHASGTFEVELTPQDDKTGGLPRGRMLIKKKFHGDLDAASEGQMLALMTSVKDSAGYVAIERVSGTLQGRKGSFALQHNGTMARGAQRLIITVVPDSGTDELTGLTGEMAIRIADGKHYYEFDYSLDQAGGDQAQEELLRLEKEFTQAIVKNDAPAIGRFVADDWVIIDPDGGVIDRTRFLDVIKSGALTHSMMESEDLRVRIYGDTATVTGLTTAKGKFMGQEFTTQERSTDVFVKRNGRWQCVLTQLTRFTKK
ncbi:MAG: hypothetical protein JMDDDDMK_01342 [Acidobacteria bacterium]|nr:hypothetical protein [Acidobacteriota bacterium]